MKSFSIIAVRCIITAVAVADYQDIKADYGAFMSTFVDMLSSYSNVYKRSDFKNVLTNDKHDSTSTEELVNQDERKETDGAEELSHQDELEKELTMEHEVKEPSTYKTGCLEDLNLIGNTTSVLADTLEIFLTKSEEIFYYDVIFTQTINGVTIELEGREAKCTSIQNDKFICETNRSLNNLYGVYTTTGGQYEPHIELKSEETNQQRAKRNIFYRWTPGTVSKKVFHSWEMSRRTSFIINSDIDAEKLKVYIVVIDCYTDHRQHEED